MFEISLQNTPSAIFGVFAELIVERDALVHMFQLEFPKAAGHLSLGKMFPVRAAGLTLRSRVRCL